MKGETFNAQRSTSNAQPGQPLTLEVGKAYRTRDGRKVTDLRRTRKHMYPWEFAGRVEGGWDETYWTAAGVWSVTAMKAQPLDLVAEWEDAGPEARGQRTEDGSQKPVRDLHECAARSAAEHAEFQEFYVQNIVGSTLMHELMRRKAWWAAVEKAAWVAWRGAKRQVEGQGSSVESANGGSHE